jgi:hypothetical protein
MQRERERPSAGILALLGLGADATRIRVESACVLGNHAFFLWEIMHACWVNFVQLTFQCVPVENSIHFAFQ